MNIELVGRLGSGVSAKDVVLCILKLLTVKGGVGYVIEYSGEGIKTLSVTDRATITNMGAELGATSSIFPSDEAVHDFLRRQRREMDFVPLSADPDAQYDKKIRIDLSKIKPMTAKPHSPDNVEEVQSLKGVKVDQVAIGSCTNSSYTDLMKVAAILKGKRVHSDVSLVISPGSSNILKMMADNGTMGDLIAAGARIIEAACGPCIGMGQAPTSGGVSLRTFNRNFKGRCGTDTAGVYIVSPETAAVSAITGYLTSPDAVGFEQLGIELPESFEVYDNYFIYPSDERADAELVMGPNIKPFPVNKPLEHMLKGKLLLKMADNITTDDIMPSSAKLLPYRSNIPELSKYCFGTIVSDFRERALKNGGGLVLGGENYGQGSSREHAALVPLHLGVKAVLVKSFARIHMDNLINSGILPLVLIEKNDYELFDEYDEIEISDVIKGLKTEKLVMIFNKTKDIEIPCRFEGSGADVEILIAGGYLNYMESIRKGGSC
jgi:aconitate hydratase